VYWTVMCCASKGQWYLLGRGAKKWRPPAGDCADRSILFGDSNDGRQTLGHIEPDCLAQSLIGRIRPRSDNRDHAFALGRADTAACQRLMLAAPSGIGRRAGFMKSRATCVVISATV